MNRTGATSARGRAPLALAALAAVLALGPVRTSAAAALLPRRMSPRPRVVAPGLAAAWAHLRTSPGAPGLAPTWARLRAEPRAPEAQRAPDRVVAPTHAGALFAQHSWLVLPPAPLPAPPSPPAPPTAPPLPFKFVGSYARAGDAPVFFLAHGDRVIDAHVGDRLDGVYQLESATEGQLVFVYLPLNVRQNVAAGVPR